MILRHQLSVPNMDGMSLCDAALAYAQAGISHDAVWPSHAERPALD